MKNEPMIGLCDLVEGAVHLCASNYDEASNAFKKCIEKRKEIKSDNDNNSKENNDHIIAFAMFELGTILIQSTEVC